MKYNRSEYLKNKAQDGYKIMGVAPALYPKELLWAFDILPAEIWDPPYDPLLANAHLQTTICPVVKRILEFILTDSDTINAGYLFPHTCDSLQNLGTQVKDLIGTPAPVFSFYNPKEPFDSASKVFYKENLLIFQKSLEQHYGPLDPTKLRTVCELGLEIDNQLSALQKARMSDQITLNNLEYFQLIRAGEYMLPHEYLDLLEKTQVNPNPVNENQKRLLVSGILPPNNDLLSLLDELNVALVTQDLLSGSRRIPIVEMDVPGDSLEYLTDRFFHLPPCPTKAGNLHERLQYLKKLVDESRSQGILFNMVKFCEPELFDHRFLVKASKDMGLPTLTLETELQPTLFGQERTRIEAFIEMLHEDLQI